MPARAPSRPAFQEPAVLTTRPFSYSLVFSPKYRALPGRPAAPWKVLDEILAEKCTVPDDDRLDALDPLRAVRHPDHDSAGAVVASLAVAHFTVPGASGRNGLSMVVVNRVGSGAETAAATPVAGARAVPTTTAVEAAIARRRRLGRAAVVCPVWLLMGPGCPPAAEPVLNASRFSAGSGRAQAPCGTVTACVCWSSRTTAARRRPPGARGGGFRRRHGCRRHGRRVAGRESPYDVIVLD